jgi:hypothetical protein
MYILLVLFSFLLQNQNPKVNKQNSINKNSVIHVAFPKGVLEYQRLWLKLYSLGNVKKTSIKNLKNFKGNLITFGKTTSLKAPNNKNVWEMFICGNPLKKQHNIIPFQSSPEKWAKLISSSVTTKKLPILLISTPRVSNYLNKIKVELNKVKVKSKLVTAKSEKEGLKILSVFYKTGKIPYWGIFLAHDLTILNSRILAEVLKIQYKMGVLSFVRTKHEVLAGGFATSEPYYNYKSIIEIILKGKKTNPITSKFYYNPLAGKSLNIKTAKLKNIGALPISR